MEQKRSVEEVLKQKQRDRDRRRRENESQREEAKKLIEKRDNLRKKAMKNPNKFRLFFFFERCPESTWPEPRNIRTDLSSRMCRKYNGELIKNIPLSTEFILKRARKDKKIQLKYKVIIHEWDEGIETRTLDMEFTEKMFRWEQPDMHEYGIFEESFID